MASTAFKTNTEMSRRRSSKALKRQLARPPVELGWFMRTFLWVFRSPNSSVLTISLLFVLFYGLQSIVLASDLEVRTGLLVLFAFLVFGIFLGVVIVTEEDSTYTVSGSRIRIICGVITGVALAVMGNVSFEGVALAGMFVGALGYFGIYWVKHI
jgi:hypothetical protein